ncbi:39S ribosomal protein L54, mitochondrial [Octopus sinensis]|uniref:Large ribosomal subunit protein mL54 n=1 Tax=Octopus sinensis TaxID=2607531 RepID=A0A6P7UA14_9MOLL|nr:39S ribosomal protein L54, mitochondrial [Octopus sinensis]
MGNNSVTLKVKMAVSFHRLTLCSLTLQSKRALPNSPFSYACIRHAKKLAGLKMSAQPVKKEKLPVETDVDKLLKYVCGANIVEGSEMIEIKADHEYPDWLWQLNTGPPPSLDELDPNDRAYWRRLRKMSFRSSR